MSENTHTLKSLRELAGMSQEALGRRLLKAIPDSGDPVYTQTRIGAYEQGRNKVPLLVAQHLVTILNEELGKAGYVENLATFDALVHPKHRTKIKRGRAGAKKVARKR
jgi:transcriptional regulator with XRE-family HTH domain